MDEIYARMPEGVIWVEDFNWYDWIAFYLDEKTGQRYSRNWYPIAKDEMCKYWHIYKVELEKYWDWTFEYKRNILSTREDKDE